ncbi:MAG: hypothetical protein RLP44_25995 [Aggregatilineales bacterium]
MRQLTIQRVMLVTVFVLLLSLATRIPVDTDTWWHIRSGEHTLTEGMIYEDPFSFTKQGEEWINHSWGSQIILYGAYQILGNIGLSLYTAILATAGMAMLYQICAGNVYLRSFILVLGAATAAVFWSARPQMTSFFLSTVILYLLYMYKYKKVDRLWLVPPVMLVWGNLHAGFSIGFIFMGGVIAGEILGRLLNPQSENVISWTGIRKLIIVAVISVAMLVINPYDFKMLLVPFQTVSIGALRDFIQEWNSPNFQGRQTWPFIFMIFGLIGALGATSKKMDITDFLLVCGTAFMAFLYGRNIAVFAVVATPILTYYLDAVLKERGWILRPIQRVTRRQARINAVLLGLIVFGALANMIAVLAPASVETAQRAFLPMDVAEFIEAEQPTGPMFNSYNWGGYLMFALPDYPVYVDGRTDLYKDEFLTRYLQTAVGGTDWREVLDEDGINMVVVESRSGLALNLREEAGWTLAYEDNKAVIFTRDEPL